MKLSENDFSMGDFNHLYMNLTTCAVENTIALAKREQDKYHPFYRYYDVEISQELFDILETPQCVETVIEITEQILLTFFSTPQFDNELIHTCVSEAVTKGENMLIKFKVKQTTTNKAIIYLRYLDNGRYFPLLRVFDSEDTLIFEKDLPETFVLDAYGEIQLSRKKITIKPRKNHFARNLEPISFIL